MSRPASLRLGSLTEILELREYLSAYPGGARILEPLSSLRAALVTPELLAAISACERGEGAREAGPTLTPAPALPPAPPPSAADVLAAKLADRLEGSIHDVLSVLREIRQVLERIDSRTLAPTSLE